MFIFFRLLLLGGRGNIFNIRRELKGDWFEYFLFLFLKKIENLDENIFN